MDQDQGLLFEVAGVAEAKKKRSDRSGPHFRDPLDLDLFPYHPSSDIPRDHLVRKIGYSVLQLDLRDLVRTYERRGGYPYDPRQLLAVVIYGMTEGVRSGQELSDHCQYDLRYRFLMGGHRPSPRSFERFLKRAEPFIEDVFAQVVQVAKSCGMGKANEVAIDGCKVPGNSSWWKHRKESEVTPSDTDARLMISHGRHLVGYNVQIALDTTDDLIVAADVTNMAVDWHVGPDLMHKMKMQHGELPCVVIADSGFETPSTIVQLGEMGIDTVIAPRKGFNDNLSLNADRELVCPVGKLIVENGSSKNGERTLATFRPIGGCRACPLGKTCQFKGKNIQLTPGDDPSAKFRNQERVDSEAYRGALIRRRAVERPFASLRCHDKFGGFHRRGLKKVCAEFLLWATSYNLRKLYQNEDWLKSRVSSPIILIWDSITQYVSNTLWPADFQIAA